MRTHIHSWITVYQNGTHTVQECLVCGRHRSTMYDMTYGCVYWEDGYWWGKEAITGVSSRKEGKDVRRRI